MKNISQDPLCTVPSPTGVKGHTGDDRNVTCAPKLKHLMSSVKVPNFQHLKPVTVKTNCTASICQINIIVMFLLLWLQQSGLIC